MFLWMTLLTGVIYPLLITGIAQLTMKHKADGNLIYDKNRVIGAHLIGQQFESARYFWGRPSAADYNPLPSGGSNLGPTSAPLKKIVQERQRKIMQAHATEAYMIPPELLFASGSGLDPHISISTAYFQVERIARARNVESGEIMLLLNSLATRRAFGFLGEAYVNVLQLNLALDALSKKTGKNILTNG